MEYKKGKLYKCTCTGIICAKVKGKLYLCIKDDMDNCSYIRDNDKEGCSNDFTNPTNDEIYNHLKAEAIAKGLVKDCIHNGASHTGEYTVKDDHYYYDNSNNEFVLDGFNIWKDGVWADVTKFKDNEYKAGDWVICTNNTSLGAEQIVLLYNNKAMSLKGREEIYCNTKDYRRATQDEINKVTGVKSNDSFVKDKWYATLIDDTNISTVRYNGSSTNGIGISTNGMWRTNIYISNINLWKELTQEETNRRLIKYAKLKYPVGSHYDSIFGFKNVLIESDLLYDFTDKIRTITCKGGVIYSSNANEWARIIPQKTKLTIKDLVEGEIYSHGEWISKYIGCNDDYITEGGSINDNSYYKPYGNWGNINSFLKDIKHATTTQKKWLKVCINANKFIYENKLDMYNDDGILIKGNDGILTKKSNLELAKERYKAGMTIKSTYDGEEYILSNNDFTKGSGSPNDIWYKSACCLYDTDNGWAKIVKSNVDKFPVRISFYVKYCKEFTGDLYDKLMEWSKSNSDGKPRGYNDTYKGLEEETFYVFDNWGLHSTDYDTETYSYGVDNCLQACKEEYSISQIKSLIDYKELNINTAIHSGKFKPGDKVKVVRKVRDGENNWDNSWVDKMDKNIGKIVTIRNIDLWGYNIEEDIFVYPEFVLEACMPNYFDSIDSISNTVNAINNYNKFGILIPKSLESNILERPPDWVIPLSNPIKSSINTSNIGFDMTGERFEYPTKGYMDNLLKPINNINPNLTRGNDTSNRISIKHSKKAKRVKSYELRTLNKHL